MEREKVEIERMKIRNDVKCEKKRGSRKKKEEREKQKEIEERR
jgi:hypothetical protein